MKTNDISPRKLFRIAPFIFLFTINPFLLAGRCFSQMLTPETTVTDTVKFIPVIDTDNDGELEGYKNPQSFMSEYVLDPLRFSLMYEVGYKFVKPDEIIKNRFSLRLEYNKLLFGNYFFYMDTKLFAFMKNDHRGRNMKFFMNDKPYKAEMSFGSKTRDVYLQTSIHKTSIRLGLQALVWGESDFAAVTDEISPIDYREPLTLNIDELKVGQLMFSVDQYSTVGIWSAFFTPFPKFNQYPNEGTYYYFDPFNGTVKYKKEEKKGNVEYGFRWKKNIRRGDVSVIATSLVNNDYSAHMDTAGQIIQKTQRFHSAGLTFNYTLNNFLVKGEFALKSPKVYNDASFQLIKKNTFDASVGVDYSLNNTLTLSAEAVNYHILGWDEKLTVSRNNYMLLLIASKQLLKNDLSVNWVTMYNGPNSGFFNLLTSYYKLNDRTTFYFDLLLPMTNNVNSGLYLYRNQKQVVFKAQYQF